MRTRTNDIGLPLYVYFKNGAYYYVVPSTKKWIRLHKDKETAIAVHSQIKESIGPKNSSATYLAERGPIIDTSSSSSPDLMVRARQVRLAVEILERAKQGASSRNLCFSLSKQDVFNLVAKADGHCMLTDIPFSDENTEGTKKRLWRPSLDRIDSSRGYEAGNVRLVCVATNFALQEHGDSVFEKLAFAYVEKRLKSAPKLVSTALLKQIVYGA